MHEVVNIQLGERANYTATHFWNTQESYFTYDESKAPFLNHNVHFRAGVGADGTDTFTPRTVIYDLKGGFGSLRKFNALYELQDQSESIQGLWDGSTTTHVLQCIEPTRYQKHLDHGLPTFQLQDSDIRYWSDFNRVYFHPSSIVQLNEYELNSQLMPFENWSAGEELFQTIDKEFDLLDRDFRLFAEECDQMQAIQMFASTDDAWGGFAARYADSLRDEYGKTSLWVWGIENSRHETQRKALLQSANAVRTLRSLAQQASAYVRVSEPPGIPRNFHLDQRSEWQCAALSGLAYESVTLPTRLNPNGGRQGSYSLFESILNTNGSQNILEMEAIVQGASPASRDGHSSNLHRRRDVRITEGDHRHVGNDSRPISFQFSVDAGKSRHSRPVQHIFASVETSRGVDDLWHDQVADGATFEEGLPDDTTVEKFNCPQPFPLLDSYPGNLFDLPEGSNSVAVKAVLLSTAQTKLDILKARDTTMRAFARDERESLYNDLTEIAEAYDYGWNPGSDTGEDE